MTDLNTLIRRAWPVLLEAIRQGRTLTYTELAGRGGPPLHRRHLHRQLLIPLAKRCREANLPDLCALVVRKDTGMPGAGWHALTPRAFDPDREWAEALEACFTFRWPPEMPKPLLIESELVGKNRTSNRRKT